MPIIGFGQGLDLSGSSGALIQSRLSGNIPFKGDPDVIGSELQARGLNEFQDANRRFEGVTQSVFDEAGQVGLSQAVNKAGAEAGSSFDTQESALLRRQRGLGLNLSARQQRSQGRRLNLSRELAKASAKGATRRGFRDRAAAAKRGAGDIEDSLFAIEGRTEIGLANAAGQDKIREENRKAAKKQARNALIGSVIGAGASILMMSDENVKVDKRPVRGSLLDKLKKIRVEKWKYMGENTDHIGPYAQEFNDTFGLGQDDNSTINIIDALGVTLGAVKELSEKIDG